MPYKNNLTEFLDCMQLFERVLGYKTNNKIKMLLAQILKEFFPSPIRPACAM